MLELFTSFSKREPNLLKKEISFNLRFNQVKLGVIGARPVFDQLFKLLTINNTVRSNDLTYNDCQASITLSNLIKTYI
jgi:hypothetical protein